jgi:regulator of RNase E activity RraB
MLMAMLMAAATSSAPNPRAAEFFDAQPVLLKWALERHDANRDGWLTMFEASAAADDFKSIADADHDGRVTVRELEAAKAFLGSRFGLSD